MKTTEIEKDPATTADYLKSLPQYLLPHHALSRLMHRFARLEITPLKNLAIDFVVRHYDVDMSQAVEPDPRAYASFNRFFTRALRPEARPITEGLQDLACPVDGFVSQIGDISDGEIIQAKGRNFSALDLLGGIPDYARPFEGGRFATLYLSPRDYHRIHSPVEGHLKSMVHIPGRLFSVSPQTTKVIPKLFARNERVALFFDTPAGPMAMVLVGAIFVGSIETVWSGEVTPPKGKTVKQWDFAWEDLRCERGQEIGRFNMGSTVILLFGRDRMEWAHGMATGARVKMGQRLGRYR